MIRSPLDDLHRSLGGRFVEFGGWELPVSYTSVLSEHRAVREHVGVFDVSHLGRFELTGPGAHVALRRLLCNDIDRIEPGRAQYTMILNEDGGIIDDLIVWWWELGRYWVMPNAANHERVMASFAAEPECSARDLRDTTVFLAVQGPEAPALLTKVLGLAPKRFDVMEAALDGDPCWMAGTGYTGERGGELCVAAETGRLLMERLIESGAVPCGLGARDTLRLESGLPLWGQDLDETTTPLEAGLDFAVDLDHQFVGRERLSAQSAGGVDRRLAGLVLEGRGVPRHGHRIRVGASAGVVTSGNISPTLDRGIALGYLAPPGVEGQKGEIEIRERWIPARVTKPPFHKAAPPSGPS